MKQVLKNLLKFVSKFTRAFWSAVIRATSLYNLQQTMLRDKLHDFVARILPHL